MEEFDPNKNEAWDYWDEWAFGVEAEFTIPLITHNIRPKTNQLNSVKTKSACTIVWALNQLIRLFALDLSVNESDNLCIEVVDYCAKNFKYVPWSWWGTPTAINAVVHRWNEIWAKKFGKEGVFYVRRNWADPEIKEALDKWHLVWYTFNLNFWEDRKKWLVRKDSYPSAGGHRLNWQATKTTKPTWWASEPTADCWVYDNLYWLTNQYLIRDRSKYINKWMYPSAYLILPQSTMDKTVEEVKENIAETKAINYALWALTTAWANVPEKYQEKFATLAKEMREDFKDARPIENDNTKKVWQTLADALSYCWKYMPEDIQKDMATLASKVRTNLNVK